MVIDCFVVDVSLLTFSSFLESSSLTFIYLSDMHARTE